ncbi:hypothetical protein BXZ70DRAFT_932023 [Cristinia sonorae]|uniref:Uncharacterized protein n=1 Tax=Cristinia sonorae TaxID=1940300 RepID=A0A8K0UPZ2_9AGAR|nr:hypothetical protein BXZ70DRAFT_932023 [Cristinia sonorae]
MAAQDEVFTFSFLAITRVKMVQLKITALFSVFTALSSFAAAAPKPESAAVPAIQSARFDYNATASAYVAQLKNVSAIEVYFDYTISHPNGSTTAILRQNFWAIGGYAPAPVWSGYAKVDFDRKNKIVGYEDRWYSTTAPYGEPTDIYGFNRPISDYEKTIARYEKNFNAKRVPIGNHGLRVYGYIYWSNGVYQICSVFHFKRNSDGVVISLYRAEFGYASDKDLTPSFVGEWDNQWIV